MKPWSTLSWLLTGRITGTTSDGSNQVAADNKEDIDSDIAARHVGMVQVEQHHRHHSKRPEAIDVRLIAHETAPWSSCGMHRR